MLKFTVRSPFLLIYIFFICINFSYKLDGGTNSDSRFAMMRAMLDEKTFIINKYREWTVDWSQTPDQNYYSNKAPGPSLLGLPAFYFIDKIRPQEVRPSMIFENYLCMITQVVPFLLALAVLVYFMRKKNVPWRALHLMVLLLLFGNTAALFMNTFFGHGFVGTLIVLLCIGLYTKKDFLIGLSYGLCLLSEYGLALFLLPLLLYLGIERKNFRWLGFFVLGGLIPAVLWVWYHVSCFDSPFVIAAKYMNPYFQSVKSSNNLFNIFSTEFRWKVFFMLLFGGERGILVTQPWVLFLIGLIPMQIFKRDAHREHQGLVILGITLFTLLLLMNVNFGTWNSGWAPGPRYLSPAFVFLAFIVGLSYDTFSLEGKSFLWLGALVAFVVFASVASNSILAPEDISLFEWFSRNVYSDIPKYSWMKFIGFLVIFAVLNVATWVLVREQELFGMD
ncbi:MAG: hypothetical protein HYV97_09675 [Bdellovibrio sp.]|nr:hypothetical protein [Bdellovibrio sp.]